MSKHRRRRRRLGAGLALGATAALAGTGIAPAPADAQQAATSTTVTCTVSTSGSQGIRIRTTGLAPDTEYATLAVADDARFRPDGVPFWTDANGVLTTPRFLPAPVPFDLAWVVYHDTDGNNRWSGADETFYRGEGAVTACPQTVTLSPK